MKRRSFIGALVATFATPAKMLAPVKPILPLGFVSTVNYGEYTLHMHRRLVEELKRHAQPLEKFPLFKGEIGHYEGVRFIRRET